MKDYKRKQYQLQNDRDAAAEKVPFRQDGDDRVGAGVKEPVVVSKENLMHQPEGLMEAGQKEKQADGRNEKAKEACGFQSGRQPAQEQGPKYVFGDAGHAKATAWVRYAGCTADTRKPQGGMHSRIESDQKHSG